jgi:hypothetical protein
MKTIADLLVNNDATAVIFSNKNRQAKKAPVKAGQVSANDVAEQSSYEEYLPAGWDFFCAQEYVRYIDQSTVTKSWDHYKESKQQQPTPSADTSQ